MDFNVNLMGIINISKLNKEFGSLVIEQTLSDTFECKYYSVGRSNAIKTIESDIKKKSGLL